MSESVATRRAYRSPEPDRSYEVDAGPVWAQANPSLPYTIPFIVFMAFLALHDQLATLFDYWEYPIRVVALALVLIVCSRHVIDLRVKAVLPTVAIGVLVFAIWVAPDVLFPGYRSHWLFENNIVGRVASSVPEELRANGIVLWSRAIRAVILVPIIEELFWRAWLMRWLISADFRRVPLGAFTVSSMVITAVLFASEHGSYWDVGLLAGFIYNWWMVKTKSLGDCILAHAVTNGILSAYTVFGNHWHYW